MTESADLHPIATFAADLVEQGPDKTYALDDAALARIAEALAEIGPKAERGKAAMDLIRVACFLDAQPGSHDAAMAILGVLEAAGLIAHAAHRDFDRFRGASGAPKAPQVGDAAPEGSLKVGSLDYPKRG
jgi:hypothetical protein